MHRGRHQSSRNPLSTRVPGRLPTSCITVSGAHAPIASVLSRSTGARIVTMGARIVAMLLALVGCGRIGFGDDGAPGGETDGATARTYLFQDGFEGTLAPWSALGNVAVDNGLTAMEGNTVLRAQAPSSNSSRAEVNLARTIGDGSAVYVRAYYYLPSGYTISDLSLLEIVQ